jgi:hypothetical protein
MVMAGRLRGTLRAPAARRHGGNADAKEAPRPPSAAMTAALRWRHREIGPAERRTDGQERAPRQDHAEDESERRAGHAPGESLQRDEKREAPFRNAEGRRIPVSRRRCTTAIDIVL